MWFGFEEFGVRVWGLGSRVVWFRVECLGMMRMAFSSIKSSRTAWRSQFRIQYLGFWVQDSRFRVQGSGFRVSGSGFRVQGSGLRIEG